jgi:hypothetical protein
MRSTLVEDEEEGERVAGAVEVVAEMQLTAEQLRSGLRTLPAGFGAALFGPDAAASVETTVRDTAKRLSGALRERTAQELALLPFSRCVCVSGLARCGVCRKWMAKGGGRGGGASCCVCLRPAVLRSCRRVILAPAPP